MRNNLEKGTLSFCLKEILLFFAIYFLSVSHLEGYMGLIARYSESQ